MKEINLDKEIEKAQKKLDELIEQKSKRRAELQSDLVDQINSLVEKIGLNDQFSLKVINRTALYHGEAYSKLSMINLVSSITGRVYRTFDVEDYSAEEILELIENSLNQQLDRYKLIDQLIASRSNLEEPDSVDVYRNCMKIRLDDSYKILIDFNASADKVAVSASKQFLNDALSISIKVEENVSLVVEKHNESAWVSSSLDAKFETDRIECEESFGEIDAAIEKSLTAIKRFSNARESDLTVFLERK